MRKEIQNILTTLEIEGKETRKKTARNILIVVILATGFYLIPYFYMQLSALWAIDFLISGIGVGYIVFEAIPTLYQPLKKEFYAFKRIARAIEILEKSNESVAYEEAYRCLKHAHKILKDIKLKDLEWYAKTNQTLNRFLENLQLIILPAIAGSYIWKEHLEEIALALSSTNASKIEAVNERLEAEPSYRKAKPPPRKTEIFARKFRESTYAFVFVLAIGCCIFFYTVVNYLEISKDNALIVSVALLIGILTIYFRKQLK